MGSIPLAGAVEFGCPCLIYWITIIEYNLKAAVPVAAI
jgi:hypothetical protein